MLCLRWMASGRSTSCRDPGIKFWIGAVACACVLAFFSQNSWAGPLFGPRTDFPAGLYLNGLVKGDLNGDGKMDLVVWDIDMVWTSPPYGIAKDSISVFLGNGDGTFAPRIRVYTGLGQVSVAIGDLNRDGRPDLVVACQVAPYWAKVLLGNGDGTFGPPTPFALPLDLPQLVELGDLDRDGCLDAIVCGQTDAACLGQVMVLLGDGSGALGAAQTFDTLPGADPYGLAIGDFNLDGSPDVVVSNAGHWQGPACNTVSVLLGNGDGALQAHQEYVVGSNPHEVAIGDLDADGKPDLAVVNTCWYGGQPFTVSVLRGKGDGTFWPKSDYAAGPWPVAIEIADLDVDGKLDLAVVNTNYRGVGEPLEGPGSVSVFLGRGDGTFDPKTDYEMGGLSNDLVVADLNGDGLNDLAVTNNRSHTISVLLNRSHVPALFGDRKDIEMGEGPSDIAVGDLNGDGRLDLVATNPGWIWGNCPPVTHETKVSVRLGRGDGTLGERTPFEVGQSPWSIAIGDVNRDGKLDVVTSNYWEPCISVLLGNGDGSLQGATDFPLAFGANRIAIGDLDRDGCLDVVAAGVDENRPGVAEVLLGNGNGTFRQGSSTPIGVDPVGVEIGDLNRDGCPDVALTNLWSHTVSVLLGRGDGTFEARPDLQTGPGPSRLAIGDLNRDGRLDLVTGDSWAGGAVSLFFGRGDGTFEPRREIAPGGPGPAGIVIADLNVDGRPDLAVGCYPSLQVLLGRGDGTFEAPARFETPSHPTVLVAADLNRDAAPDLLMNEMCSNMVSVFVNRSLTIPVAVENLEAVAAEGRVRLSWGLSAEMLRDLRGIRVERALTPEGPYAECTVSPLEPAHQMSFDDVETLGGVITWYRLVLLLENGSEVIAGPVSIEIGSGLPSRTALHQPFEPDGGGLVQIRYSLSTVRAPVRLAIYDVRGRVVWSLAPATREPGEHSQVWDRRDSSGAHVSRGVYLVRLETGKVSASRKLVLVHR